MFENVNVRGVPTTDADILEKKMDPDDADFYKSSFNAILKALAELIEALPDLSEIKVKAVSTAHGGPLWGVLKRSRGRGVLCLCTQVQDDGKGGRSSSTHAALGVAHRPACCGRLW